MNRCTRPIEVGACWMVTALILGCSATEDERLGQGENPRAGGPQADLLPPPKQPRGEPLHLDTEQRRKYEEKELYLAEEYRAQGWQIAETTQTYSGDIVDWLDPSSVPGSEVEPPPKPSPEELQPSPGATLGLTEFDLYPEVRGPEGTVPVLRPSFAQYVLEDTGTTSIEEFLAQDQVPGMPAGQDRLYEGIVKVVPNTGAHSWVAPYGGTIEAGTMSLLEMAIVTPGSNPSTTLEQIGIALSRDKVNFGYQDSDVRLQIEFMAMGDITGDDKGGWHGLKRGFVPTVGSSYPIGSRIQVSIIGGPRVEHKLQIQLSGGNWWIGFNGTWLGYYPGSLFDLIKTSAAKVYWYGEVYDSTPTDWTWTDMGSGLFASAGLNNAAYFRQPFYVTPSGSAVWVDNTNDVLPIASACYTKSPLYTGSTYWERYFYASGPGGEAKDCD